MHAQAMFGAGCFWGVEERFRQTPGVLATAVGYAGGALANPTYEQVCSDRTGHAEVVHLTFDPAQIDYEDLLRVFFDCHDPTQVNRQGPDYGSQYRSVVFTYGPEQQAAAERVQASLAQSGRFKRPLATQVLPAPEFYRAEDYHQQYLAKRGLGSCHR